MNFHNDTIYYSSCQSDTDLLKTFTYINLAVYGIAFFLHTIGLIGLFLHKKETNQKLILIQLSTVELLLTVTGFILRPNDDLREYLTEKSQKAIFCIEETAILELVLTMNILTVDRLICILNPLKYKSRITKKRLITTSLFSWPIAVILPICELLVKKAQNAYIYAGIALASCFVLLAFITYSIVLYKLRQSNQHFASSSTGRNTASWKQFLIPGAIILTFVFLYGIPIIIFRTVGSEIDKQGNSSDEDCLDVSRIQAVTRFFQCLGLITDPIIYIFLSQEYRSAIFNFCKSRCCKQNENKLSSNNMELGNIDNP